MKGENIARPLVCAAFAAQLVAPAVVWSTVVSPKWIYKVKLWSLTMKGLLGKSHPPTRLQRGLELILEMHIFVNRQNVWHGSARPPEIRGDIFHMGKSMAQWLLGIIGETSAPQIVETLLAGLSIVVEISRIFDISHWPKRSCFLFCTPLHKKPNNGRVAQLVEHLTFNQTVTGSNPVALTIFLIITNIYVVMRATS